MSRTALFTLAFLAVACFAAADNSWDFFVLAEQWPGGYQADTWPACTSTFTLHGLWPTRNDSTWPSACSNTPFDESKLSALLPTMNCQWPSMNGNSETFWSHEWSTHGTCAGSDSSTATEFSYFNSALQVHSNAAIYAALSGAGITPSYDTDYQVGNIRSAIQTALGVAPVLGCASHRLVTVQLCVDKTLSFIPCPQAMFSDDSCGTGSSTVWYNPIKH